MKSSRASDALPPIVAVRRRPLRKKTFLGGLIASRNGSLVFDCTIKDISEEGAKVKLAGADMGLKHLYLIVPARQIVHECQVMRSQCNEHGLKFLASYRLEMLQSTDLLFLKRLLVERLPRASVAA